jgi:Leucine-rich repeat (LRR) protein
VILFSKVRGESRRNDDTDFCGDCDTLNSFVISPGSVINNDDFTFAPVKNEAISRIVIKSEGNVKFLPVGISDIFPNLIEYFARHNPIRKVSKKNFQGMVKLKKLDLYDNSIETIEVNAFDDLISLKKLELAANLLKNLNEFTFRNLRNLKELYMNRNGIEKLPPRILEGLVELEATHIGENRFNVLPSGLFRNNKKIEKIWLNDGRLTKIDPTTFDGLSILRMVNLRGNNCISKKYGDEDVPNAFNAFRAQVKKDLKENCA